MLSSYLNDSYAFRHDIVHSSSTYNDTKKKKEVDEDRQLFNLYRRLNRAHFKMNFINFL